MSKRFVYIMVGTFVLVLAAATGYGIFNARRLNERGVETYAAVTRVYSRTEYRNGPGPRGWKHRKKITVHYLDYRFRADSAEYTGRCRRSEQLMTARAGDSLLVCYLPDAPDVNRPVHREEGSFVLKRSVRSGSRLR